MSFSSTVALWEESSLLPLELSYHDYPLPQEFLSYNVLLIVYAYHLTRDTCSVYPQKPPKDLTLQYAFVEQNGSN
jgi:hypothetical protein